MRSVPLISPFSMRDADNALILSYYPKAVTTVISSHPVRQQGYDVCSKYVCGWVAVCCIQMGSMQDEGGYVSIGQVRERRSDVFGLTGPYRWPGYRRRTYRVYVVIVQDLYGGVYQRWYFRVTVVTGAQALRRRSWLPSCSCSCPLELPVRSCQSVYL